VRVLVLTQRLPYEPNRGDRIRTYYTLRHIAGRYDVEVVSLVHNAEEASHVHALYALGIHPSVARIPRLANLIRGAVALPGSQPLTHVLLWSPQVVPALLEMVSNRPPDVVLAYCSSMARFAMEPPLAGRPFVVDMIDVDSAKWQALAESSSRPKKWIYAREHRTLSAFEIRVARSAAATLVVNERERDLLDRLAPGAPIHVVQNGVDVDWFRPQGPPVSAPVAVFCGVMDYGPNEAAAIWVTRDVWPRVLSEHRNAHLMLVGANPTAAVRALAGASVTVTGSVPDVRPYLWSAALGLAPLHLARGIQNKVLEAVAAGLPTVVTHAVAEGLPNEVLSACLVADSPEMFARGISRLFAMRPEERRAMAGNAPLASLSWAARLAPVPSILEQAARRFTVRRD
jgi:sugar transferase (PEP-CTERM/EpsH1 system associated)